MTLTEALQIIASFPDGNSELDDIMEFRWSAVMLARSALEKAGVKWTPEEVDDD